MKVAILGCGKQAWKHIDGINNSSLDCEIGVFDLQVEAAQKLASAKNVSVYGDIENVFSDDEVKAVIISTPPHSHYDLIISSLEAGKHVFCEKPLCETKSQAYLIEEKSKETGCFVQIGFVYRYVSDFIKLKSMLTDPDRPLGEPVSAIFRIGGRGSHQLWKHQQSKGGGATSEMLVHMLDLACWFFGSLNNVNWHERKLLRPEREINGKVEKVDAEDYVTVSCQSDTGINILFQADLITPAFRQCVELQGTNGSFVGSIQSDIPSYAHLIDAKGKYAAGRNEIDSEAVNLFDKQMAVFLENVQKSDLGNSPNVSESIQFFNFLQMNI